MQGLREQVGQAGAGQASPNQPGWDWVPWDAVDFLLRLFLAGVLLYASADKIIHPQDFASVVKDYRILPESLWNVTAIWLPWFELVLGVCLFTGLWCEGALALTTGLLSLFWLVLIVNYFRGINVGCGCFSSTPDEAAPMLWYIGRDALLLALAFASVEARRRALAKAQG